MLNSTKIICVLETGTLWKDDWQGENTVWTKPSSAPIQHTMSYSHTMCEFSFFNLARSAWCTPYICRLNNAIYS